MTGDSDKILEEWLFPGEPIATIATPWTKEVAAAKLAAAKDAAKTAHEAAEALRELAGSAEDFHDARGHVLSALRYLRQAFQSLKNSE